MELQLTAQFLSLDPRLRGGRLEVLVNFDSYDGLINTLEKILTDTALIVIQKVLYIVDIPEASCNERG